MTNTPTSLTTSESPVTSVGAVIIGRNEGERLVQCLKSIAGQIDRAVYVDSGSSDDSIAHARAAGTAVVELDLSRPFTHARARNAGFKEILNGPKPPDYVQFVDGDCQLRRGWLQAARRELDADDTLGIVTGWRSEIHRDRSIYNAMCDYEWRGPTGDILACGGDMMVRRSVFEQVSGFDDNFIAAEDGDFCARVRKAGWGLRRIPVEMTRHDAAILRFSQWWQRAVRAGFGFAQIGDRHPDYFAADRYRVWLYATILPFVALVGLLTTWWLTLAAIAIYAASYLRTVWRLHQDRLPVCEATVHGGFLVLCKLPQLVGMLLYRSRQLRGSQVELIEYK